MCNSLHKDSKPIPKTGKGYKLFAKHGTGTLLPLCFWKGSYSNDPNEGIKWIPRDNKDGGFCIFPTKKDAQFVKRHWAKGAGSIKIIYSTILTRVSYKDGKGRHAEFHLCKATYNHPVDISIVGWFRVEEVIND